MTFDDFVELAKEADATTECNYRRESFRIGPNPTKYHSWKEFDETLWMYVSWETGGYSGGSCWDDSDPQPYYTGYPEPRFKSLNNLIRTNFPDIHFLDYESIMDLCETDDWTEQEYYGNEVSYSYKGVDLSVLYKFLEEKGLV